MKKILLLVALTAMSVTANASKARKAALGGAMTVMDDEQDTLTNPATMFAFGDQFHVEFFGATATTAGTIATGDNNTEGSVFRSNGDAKYGIYFGNRSTNFNSLVNAGRNAGLVLMSEENPIEFSYGQKGGDMKWAASLIYSAAENKLSSAKTSTMGLRAGAVADVWEAYINFGLAGKAEVGNAAGDKVQNDSSILVGGQYAAGDVLYFGSFDTSSGKATISNTDTKVSNQIITLGAETKMKGDTAHFFYGVKYMTTTQKTGDNGKDETSKLPLYAGLEADAASWLTLRASLSQSLLVNSRKVVNTASTTTTDMVGTNDTVAALGAGFKFGKVAIDGTMAAGTSGAIDTSAGNFMTNAALTYTW